MVQMENYAILFVDDQESVLNTYRALSRKDTSNRLYHFATDGAKAIEILWNNKIDVLITDYNMPILDGLKLTEYLEGNFPATVRVIVSGCMEYELFVDSMKHAHRFMSKPTSIKELTTLLESITFIHSIINDPSIENELLRLTTMPALPQVYNEVCKVMEDEKLYSLKAVSDIIAGDMGMSSNILKFVNSTFFSFSEQVTRIDQAVSLLGGDILKMLILRETISRFVSTGETVFVQRIFTHSSIVASVVRKILQAEKVSLDMVDLGYTIALLHDVGRLILSYSFKDKYREIQNTFAKNKSPIEEVECHVLGICHSKIAAYLFSLWGLPRSIVSPILNHHKLNILDSKNPLILAALHVADNLEYRYVGSDVLLKHRSYDTALIDSLGYTAHVEQWNTIAQNYFASLGN